MNDQSIYQAPQPVYPSVVCQAVFVQNQGYILSGFLKSISIRSQPTIFFSNQHIYSDVSTADGKMVVRNYMIGDEINLEWSSDIPESERQLCLAFELSDLIGRVSRILKKDQATLMILQNRTVAKNKFSGPESTDDFSIYIGKGGSDSSGREGFQSFPTKRVQYRQTVVIEPNKDATVNISRLNVPAISLRPMLSAFSKCKKNSIIKIAYYNADPASGRIKPGILITSQSNLRNGDIIEKYGQIPEDAGKGMSSNQVQQTINTGSLQVVLVNSTPNEFPLDPDKITFLSNFANLHSEGTIRITYEQGKDLRLAYRYGAFGECVAYLSSNRV
jgi:hypothetical protein